MGDADTKTEIAAADPPVVVAATAPVADVLVPDEDEAKKKWLKALVWAGGKLVAAGEKRGVVVTEVRTDEGALATDTRYPQSGDIYFRMGPDVEGAQLADFGGKTDGCLTLGENIQQGLLAGLSISPSHVHVGPAHPAYAGVNLAVLMGAEEVEVQGLTAFWKARLQDWFDKLPTDPWYPSTVKITLT